MPKRRTRSALLGDRPRRRDLLIEQLHLIQDHYGHLSTASGGLAEEMRLPQAEVYEVATFYAHFDVVREDETPPPPVTIRVCDSLTCELMGAQALLAGLRDMVDPDQIRVLPAPCMGRCGMAPVCEVGHRHIDRAQPAVVLAVAQSGDHEPRIPDYIRLPRYAEGGYRLWREVRDQSPASREGRVAEILAPLDDSGLRGLGGAGFPTGRKWGLVRGQPKPRYLCVNADEGEPGTFKDRHYLESDPHRFLEGLLIAAWSIEADRAFIYLRDEYRPCARFCCTRSALERRACARRVHRAAPRGRGLYLRRKVLDDREHRGQARPARLRYVAQVGLFGRPTLVNNVETLFWVRDVVERGADWFARQGRHGSKACAPTRSRAGCASRA